MTCLCPWQLLAAARAERDRCQVYHFTSTDTPWTYCGKCAHLQKIRGSSDTGKSRECCSIQRSRHKAAETGHIRSHLHQQTAAYIRMIISHRNWWIFMIRNKHSMQHEVFLLSGESQTSTSVWIVSFTKYVYYSVTMTENCIRRSQHQKWTIKLWQFLLLKKSLKFYACSCI